MNLDEITPLLLTYNEVANIDRTLSGLHWARQIVVVDSGSMDGTLDILAKYPQVRVAHRDFDDFASQCNFGLSLIETVWVLSFDADYRCSELFEDELRSLVADETGYEVEFTYCIQGKAIKGSLYPPRAVLFRPQRGRYVADGHAHRLQLHGQTKRLKSRILHDDRKSLSRWLADQAKYADHEMDKLLSKSNSDLGWKDRLRRQIVWAPLLTFFYCLLCKGLILDGWPGIYYTLQRVYAELLLSLKLLDARLRRRIPPDGKKQL